MGHNTCRCLRSFTGSMCQHKMQRRRVNKPTIVEIIGPAAPFFRPLVATQRRPHLIKLPFIPIGQANDDGDNNIGGGHPHLIKLPFLPTVTNDEGDSSDASDDDESKQRTMGHVDQSKLVNLLRKFTMPFSINKQDFGGGNHFEEESEGKLITLPFKRHNIPRRFNNRYNPYSSQKNYYNRFY